MFQSQLHGSNHLVRKTGKIGKGPVFDLSIFSVALPEQMAIIRLPALDGFGGVYIHSGYTYKP
jgi:hypothetical protein